MLLPSLLLLISCNIIEEVESLVLISHSVGFADCKVRFVLTMFLSPLFFLEVGSVLESGSGFRLVLPAHVISVHAHFPRVACDAPRCAAVSLPRLVSCLKVFACVQMSQAPECSPGPRGQA